MTEILSAQNLTKSLLEKDKYKATQAYLHQVCLFNESVYEMVNRAMQTVLLKGNRNYMSKLMALRLFKQLVICGNFTLIDALDEGIEDLILAAAQYNKKNKEVSRGANYFIEVDKQKKDAEIQKIGATFVLLASEILVVLGKWHPLEDDGEESRFSQYLKQLQNGGVPLPQEGQLTFFKKEDQEKFRKNYSNWLKWYVQKVKQQEVEETTRQIKEENNVDKNQNSKIEEKETSKLKVDEPVVMNSTLNVPNGMPLSQPVQQVRVVNEKLPEKNDKLNIAPVQSNPKHEAIREVPAKTERQKLEYEKWKAELISRYQSELAALRGENEHMKKQVNEATNLMTKTHEQKLKLEEQLHNKKKELNQLSQQKQDLQGKVNKLSQSQTKQKEQVAQCFQIKISPPQIYEQLEQQNDILQVALESAEQHFMTKKKQLQQQLLMTKEENSKLAQALQQKEEEIKKCKEESNIEKQIVKNIIKEDSLVITDEIKFTPLQNKRQASEPKDRTELFSKTCTMSEYLKTNFKDMTENVEPKVQSRNRSLRKTESTHKMSTINNCQNFYNTTVNLTKTGSTNQKLSKTSSNFYGKKPFQSTHSLITIFPYLQDYFPLLPPQSKHFKQACLEVKNKLGVCYDNDMLAFSLKKINWSKYILTISNKLNTELKIKLASEHRTFVVEGEKYKKIKPCSSEQIQVRNVEFDINLRYLSLNCVTGNQKLSLTNSSPYDRTFSVPLPITLLDFVKISTQNVDYFTQSKTSKYCSNKLSLGSCQTNFIEHLGSFKVSYTPGGFSAKAVAELPSEAKAKVLIEVQQTQYQVCVGVEFPSSSSQSANLAKVLLQVMLFVIQL